MLEGLFGGKNVEKVLFFLLKNQKCYGKQLSDVFDQALSPFQKILDRLENKGILVSFLIGIYLNYSKLSFNTAPVFAEDTNAVYRANHPLLKRGFGACHSVFLFSNSVSDRST